jgi:hypothetical protein
VEFVGLQALEARQQLNVAQGFALAHAKDARRAMKAVQDAAYPKEIS